MAKIFLGNIKGPKGDNGKNFAPKHVIDDVSGLPQASEALLGEAYFVGTAEPRKVYTCVYLNDGQTVAWVDQGALNGEDGERLYIKYNNAPYDANATAYWSEGQCYIGFLASKAKTAPATGYVWCRFIKETFSLDAGSKTLTITL